jgi:hypothetical protein
MATNAGKKPRGPSTRSTRNVGSRSPSIGYRWRKRRTTHQGTGVLHEAAFEIRGRQLRRPILSSAGFAAVAGQPARRDPSSYCSNACTTTPKSDGTLLARSMNLSARRISSAREFGFTQRAAVSRHRAASLRRSSLLSGITHLQHPSSEYSHPAN